MKAELQRNLLRESAAADKHAKEKADLVGGSVTFSVPFGVCFSSKIVSGAGPL